MIYTNIDDITEKYGIIYTDPPWAQKRGGKKAVRPNSSGKDLDYQTMKLENIVALHKQIFERNTEQSIIYSYGL